MENLPPGHSPPPSIITIVILAKCHVTKVIEYLKSHLEEATAETTFSFKLYKRLTFIKFCKELIILIGVCQLYYQTITEYN